MDELVVVSKRDRSNQACIYCSPHLEGFFYAQVAQLNTHNAPTEANPTAFFML